MKNSEIEERINNLEFRRVSKSELKEYLENTLERKIGNLDKHRINGKTYFDSDTIIDDFYSIDVEVEEGDAYICIYFLPTNEQDIIFITETTVDFDSWKKEDFDEEEN